ncbi:MAG: hypothetical protein AABZ74_17870 [Cyanobacteriota bacterium]
MRKLITSLLVISLVFFFSVNEKTYAYNINNTEIIKLEQSNNSQFFNYSIDTEKLSNNNNYMSDDDEDDDEPINPNWIVLNLLFPGLGNLVVGEFIGGTILVLLTLFPITYFTFFVQRDGAGGVGYSLNFIFLVVPAYIIIYIIDLIVTNSMHSYLSKKYKKYLKKMKNKEKKLSLENQSLVFNYEIKF